MPAASGLNGTVVFWSILAAVIVIAVASGAGVPVIGGGRGAFFALAVIGAILCGQAFTRGFLPHNPITWVGAFLGVFNLFLVAAVLFRIQLPAIPTVRTATFVLGASMAAKVVLAVIRVALARDHAL
ncbi:MAG: hypothetical protein ACM3X6_11145 [Patescibacteria group bacterium]